MAFSENRILGIKGADYIRGMLLEGGWAIEPVYRVPEDWWHGPRIYIGKPPDVEEIILTDMLGFYPKNDQWHIWRIEVKTKYTTMTLCPWKPKWQTSMSVNHWLNYCRLQDTFGHKVVFYFLHGLEPASNSPPGGPSGVFRAKLDDLRGKIDHWATVLGDATNFWNVECFKKIRDVGEGLEFLMPEGPSEIA